MVSAISICLLALGLTAVSSQLLPSEPEFSDAPISERRTFKHGKPIKIIPLKKHKKFIGLVPHVFGKAPYEVPVVHDGPKSYYKVHRYQGIEVKPVHDVTYSTPEPFIESHSIEPPTGGDFSTSFGSDFSDHSSGGYVYDKPSISFPAAPIFAPLPPSKPIFSIVPAPQPVFQSPSFSLAHSAPSAPAFAPIPASLPAPQPVFSVIPVKIQAPALPSPSPAPVFPSLPVPSPSPVFPSLPAPSPSPVFPSLPAPSPSPVFPSLPAPSPSPVFPSLPAPSPSPIFSSVPIKIHHPAPALPSISAPTPAPALPSPTPVIVKIPAPALPSVQAPVLPSIPAPSPAPILPSLSVVHATPAPAFSAIPVSLPTPQFSIAAPAPSVPTFPALPSLPVSVAPEPEFPYPPSGTPIPSYIKDISLGDIEIKDTVVPSVEPEVIHDASKNFDSGFFQKIKGWKADKANAALSHFTHFKKPVFQPAVSVAQPASIPAAPTLQFPGPVHPLPLAPTSLFPIFPPAQFISPAKYESFPPNNIESPPLLNSYGVPIPHDTYAAPHISHHDRLSSAASEEEPAVVPAPENKEQPSHKFQPQAIPHDHPVYVAEETKTDDNKTIEDAQPETEEYKTGKESDDVAVNYPNHKEN